MNILYIDSTILSFNFSTIVIGKKVECIDSFNTIDESTKYFEAREDFDLILYNPYIFVALIEHYDFVPESYFLEKRWNCIPYANPKHILPISRKIENRLISLFPEEDKSDFIEIGPQYRNSCVLVTGAGGSIGSELVLQLLENGVDSCICLDLSEFSVFNLKKKLVLSNFDNFKIVVGSYGDTNLLQKVFTENKVDLIINAGAYKHVSIMQDNMYAAITNNVLNFVQLLRAAKKFDVSDIIQVSTDKAAEPSNVMGFSKLLCEQVLINSYQYLGVKFNYSIVRFGNVVGSSGSVVPIFIDNIKNEDKLHITHQDVERFMMQISEAVSLILHAASFRKNETYILDMGLPYRIKDLAEKMLKNSHFRFDEELIEIIGLQAGEKLSEILFTSQEEENMKAVDGVFVIKNRNDSLLTHTEMQSLIDGEFEFLSQKLDSTGI